MANAYVGSAAKREKKKTNIAKEQNNELRLISHLCKRHSKIIQLTSSPIHSLRKLHKLRQQVSTSTSLRKDFC